MKVLEKVIVRCPALCIKEHSDLIELLLTMAIFLEFSTENYPRPGFEYSLEQNLPPSPVGSILKMEPEIHYGMYLKDGTSTRNETMTMLSLQ